MSILPHDSYVGCVYGDKFKGAHFRIPPGMAQGGWTVFREWFLPTGRGHTKAHEALSWGRRGGSPDILTPSYLPLKLQPEFAKPSLASHTTRISIQSPGTILYYLPEASCHIVHRSYTLARHCTGRSHHTCGSFSWL